MEGYARRELRIEFDQEPETVLALEGPPAWGLTGFTVETQEQAYWCWSAIAASLSRYFSTESTWTEVVP